MRDTRPTDVLFRDDFTEGLGKWTPNWLGNPADVTKPINGAELAAYDPACVRVVDGAGPKGRPALVLAALEGPAKATDGKTYAYRSGCITTHGKFTCVPPVRVETRMRLAGDDDEIENWPAFWLDGTGTWPHTGELDVFEGIGGTPQFHFHSDAGGPGGRGAIKDRPRAKADLGWHRFAAEWRPGRVDFEYDGQPAGSVTQGITTAPMYLIANLALSRTISPPVVVPSQLVIALVQVTKLAG